VCLIVVKPSEDQNSDEKPGECDVATDASELGLQRTPPDSANCCRSVTSQPLGGVRTVYN